MFKEEKSRVGGKKADRINEAVIFCLLLFYIVWKMPIVALYMNTYLAMVLLVSLAALLALTRLEWLKSSGIFILSLALFAILLFLEEWLANTTFLYAIWSVFLEIFPMLLGVWLIANKMDRVIERIIPIVILSFVITSITTIIGLEFFPDASRELATGGDYYLTYYKYNIGGFGFIYSLSLLHTMVVYYLRRRHRPFLAFAFTLIAGICVFKSAYTMAALLFLLSCTTYFLPVNTSIHKAKKRLTIIALVSVISVVVLPWVLELIASIEALSHSSEKILDLARLLRGEETSNADTSIRLAKYRSSWKTFTEHIFVGSAFSDKPTSGGHSFFLDIMAKWGLVGLAVSLFLHASVFGNLRRLSKNQTAFYHVVFSFILITALTVFNPQYWSFELGFFIPLVLYSTTKRRDLQ